MLFLSCLDGYGRYGICFAALAAVLVFSGVFIVVPADAVVHAVSVVVVVIVTVIIVAVAVIVNDVIVIVVAVGGF